MLPRVKDGVVARRRQEVALRPRVRVPLGVFVVVNVAAWDDTEAACALVGGREQHEPLDANTAAAPRTSAILVAVPPAAACPPLGVTFGRPKDLQGGAQVKRERIWTEPAWAARWCYAVSDRQSRRGLLSRSRRRRS